MTVVTIAREGAFAIVTINNPPVNALSRAVREGLMDAAEALDADPSVKGVVLTCAGNTFIAGADVNEFGQPPLPPHLPDVVARIEAADKPWIAAIHGSALGGGLEIALGCRFRIAAPGSSLGLPEVTLGLIPGAGGTVRTPRLVGASAAVDLVTTGKPVNAARAFAMGLIDAIARDGDLIASAIDALTERLQSPLPPTLASRSPLPVDATFWAEAEKKVKAAAKGEAAPMKALASIRTSVEKDFATAMAFERETFLERRASREAAALRMAFFAEREALRPVALRAIEAPKLETAGVIGGGTMGAGIAMALLDAGLTVTLIERDGEAAARGHANVAALVEASLKRGRLDTAGAAALLSRLSASSDYAALAGADLVIEAVFEDMAVKQAVFAQLEAVCRADAILATNTSYLDPREVGSPVADKRRYIGLHFFSPAHVMRLLEIVPVPETAPVTLAAAFALAKRLRKVPVEAGICDGFIGNRILKRYRAEAENLVREGIAIADVDAAMRAFGFPMGPFEAQDLGGLDIAFLQREGARASGTLEAEALADILVRAGRKGQKTAGGWYDYQPGERRPLVSAEAARLLEPHVSATASTPDAEEIAYRLVQAMAEEGRSILAEGIAKRAVDIDLVEIHGYGFPRRKGGPMFHSGLSG